MSLPLTRRIVRTALLIAASAAPVVGAAGAAGAAELAQVPELGGLTSVDGAGLGKTVDGVSKQGTEAGGKVVGTTLPVASKTLGETAGKAAPAAAKTVGKATTGGATGVLGDATKGGLPTDGLGALPIG